MVYLDTGPRLKGHNLESEVDMTGILTERYGDSNWKSQQLMPKGRKFTCLTALLFSKPANLRRRFGCI